MEYSGSSNEYASKGMAGAGLGLGIAGTTLGLLGPHLGLMGNNSQSNIIAEKDMEIAQLRADAATDAKLVEVYKELRSQDKAQDEKISNLNTRVTVLETSAPLREQIVLGQVNNVANSVSTLGTSTQYQINSINNTLNNITKTVIPGTACCPEYMPRYNSFQVSAISAEG